MEIRPAILTCLLLLAAWSAPPGHAAEADRDSSSRFRTERRVDVAATWIATDGRKLFHGAGRRLVACVLPKLEGVSREIGFAVTDGLLVGDSLFLAGDDGKLFVLDTAEPSAGPRVVPLEPAATGRLFLARSHHFLLVADRDFGVRILETLPRHGHDAHATSPPPEPRPAGLFPVRRVTAIGAVDGTAFVGTESGELLEIDLGAPGSPSLVRRRFLERAPTAIAANGTFLYVLNSNGARVIPRSGIGNVWRSTALRGRSLRLVGRELFVASESEGLSRYRDRSSVAVQHPVTVANNFFSPETLTIEIGDEVRWTNTSGFHNVASCFPSQDGCDGQTSNEAFGNGPPAPAIWLFDHTFVAEGFNPYICQSHAPSMTGLITVGAPSLAPPAVPDGRVGSPMLVERLNAQGSNLSIHWDAESCPGAASYHLIYGVGSRLPATPGAGYLPAGSRCALGLTSPFTWLFSPPASADSTNLLWWLVLAGGAGGSEGSWGADSAGNERDSPTPGGASGECGFDSKDLSNACGR